MSYFPDLSPYVYFDGFAGYVNIGWLEFTKLFPKGSVHPKILAEIGRLCESPSNLTRGFHFCPLCSGRVQEAYLGDGQIRLLGNGEIHVSAGGIYWN
jgi:hypothetical protein